MCVFTCVCILLGGGRCIKYAGQMNSCTGSGRNVRSPVAQMIADAVVAVLYVSLSDLLHFVCCMVRLASYGMLNFFNNLGSNYVFNIRISN